jgi:hypothetical protein
LTIIYKDFGTIFKKGFINMARRKPNDKIFDNKYNSGEVDYEIYNGPPKLDTLYASNYIPDYRQTYDNFKNKQLFETLLDIWENLKWYKIYGKKRRIPKADLNSIFLDLRGKLKDSTYTKVEVFTGIAEFLNVNYGILYSVVPIPIQIELVAELDEKYNLVEKKDIRQLF